ncbi:unnamed protein product [Polarella glacialis]|uniref:Uncharacterized protein n=1 Tax=Polarella glacialis TaxID=89957 RepID=A0A813LRU3_POLGL|nr:unnamed protein product [Polarella glacialis]
MASRTPEGEEPEADAAAAISGAPAGDQEQTASDIWQQWGGGWNGTPSNSQSFVYSREHSHWSTAHQFQHFQEQHERSSLRRTFWEIYRGCKRRRLAMSLQNLQNSPALTILAVWHTYGIWVGACVYLIISSNLLLAWYIDWYRASLECGTDGSCASSHELLHFPIAQFFAIFLRSWMLVCLVGELVRFCFLLARDAWREDGFVTYRRVVCGDMARELDAELSAELASVEAGDTWSAEMLSSCRRWLDTILQISIYACLDIVPMVCALVSYSKSQSVQSASVAASAALSVGACLHVFLFFIAWGFTDLCMKILAFRSAWRGEGQLRPTEYPGESLQNFQWGGTFGDRHWANLEAARSISFVEDGGLAGPPDRCVSAGGDVSQLPVGSSSPGRGRSGSGRRGRGSSSSSAGLGLSTGSPLRPLQLLPAIERMEVAPKAEQPHQPQQSEWRPGSAGAGSQQPQSRSVADKLNVCVPFCGWLGGAQAEFLPHICWVLAVLAGVKVRNWGLVGIGAAVGLIMVCRRFRLTDPAGFRGTTERPLFGGGGSWELWALQAWGEHHCSLKYEVQLSRRASFGFVVLLQGVLFATLAQWHGCSQCFVFYCYFYFLLLYLLSFVFF